MLCLESFAWAKERVGETTSNRIEIRCNFFDIENFFFQCLADGAHPVAFGVSIFYCSAVLEILFTGQSTEDIKKYHLFIDLSIFTKPHRAERMEHSARRFCQTPQLEDLSELRYVTKESLKKINASGNLPSPLFAKEG
jgi:hypothetical protein